MLVAAVAAASAGCADGSAAQTGATAPGEYRDVLACHGCSGRTAAKGIAAQEVLLHAQRCEQAACLLCLLCVANRALDDQTHSCCRRHGPARAYVVWSKLAWVGLAGGAGAAVCLLLRLPCCACAAFAMLQGPRRDVEHAVMFVVLHMPSPAGGATAAWRWRRGGSRAGTAQAGACSAVVLVASSR